MNPTMLIAALLLSLLICSLLPFSTFALLFPQQNEIRSLDSLDGLWTFVREPANSPGFGFANNWANLELASFPNATQLPVPAAFNELTADGELREHVGWVWYQRDYWLSEAQLLQKGRRSMLRFGSVQYNAVVFVNGREVGRHTGGHLPFEIELGLSQGYNSITVAVNNTLSNETIPPGDLKFYNLSTGDVVRQKPNFDFFNYAGILRPVQVWHLPQAHISAIKIIADSMGEISYRVDIDYGQVPAALTATNVLIFFKGSAVAKMTGNQNWTRIENALLWWPRGMGRPNLYTMQISLHSVATGTLVDVYRETFGFRTISIKEKQILLNGRPFYCHGFGMHEDFEVHGRGFDRAVMTKDLNMLEWMNGNCYRTSHYPYSEERAYEADRRGIAVITEVPAVGLRIYNRTLEKLHARIITEMVIRDRNHPSVIMWSLANEPEVHGNAQDYFKDLAILTKHLDSTRPVTVVFGSKTDRQIATDLDVVCVNYYFGWYSDLGVLPAIEEHLANTLSLLQQKIQKPLILSEYGADTVAGLHEEPGQPFTEQYQVELIRETAKALDRLRKGGQVVGEMIWNFADFMTAQDLTRVLGNHKGVLTRDRKPKMAAYTIKERYKQLMEEAEAANGQHREL